jgi:hypothetical protein
MPRRNALCALWLWAEVMSSSGLCAVRRQSIPCSVLPGSTPLIRSFICATSLSASPITPSTATASSCLGILPHYQPASLKISSLHHARQKNAKGLLAIPPWQNEPIMTYCFHDRPAQGSQKTHYRLKHIHRVNRSTLADAIT